MKMVTVLENCITEEQRSLVRFLRAKGLSAVNIHKEMFRVYGWKCLSRKVVLNWMANVSLMTKMLRRRCGSGCDNSSKNFYAAGFDALVKRWDMCIKVDGGYVEKQFFHSFDYHIFLSFISICDLFTDSPS
jgi:hypothetical protein